jgi:PKD repeat protein
MGKVSYLVLTFVILVLNQFSLTAQHKVKSEILDKKFRHYEVVSINSLAALQQLKSPDRSNVFSLDLSAENRWNLELQPSNIISDSYTAIVAGSNGLNEFRGFSALAMKGKLAGVPDSKVSLTFNENFIYGYVKLGSVYYNIEPLYHFVQDSPSDQFVIYSSNDILEVPDMKCAFENMNDGEKNLRSIVVDNGDRMPGGCYIILYSTASDFSMFQQYGGATGVQNHNIGVLNDIQTNYDNEFADEIQFQMQQQWISSCSTCNPWTESTNASTLLSSFRNWAPSNLTQTHNLASLWTRRDLDGSTIGIAYLDALCSSFRYNVLQDFTSNANTKRVLKAHEVGHNFGASHDGSGSPTIMAPSVNNSNSWSAASVSSIQAGYLSASCLGTCQSVNPPVANFTYNVLSQCVPGQVQYSDISTGATSRVWSFPGGTPSTSTAANPLVSYAQPGTYGATLTVSGPGGSNSYFVSTTIVVENHASASFSYFTTTSNTTVSFSYSGSNGQFISWNFGDGFGSSLTNPVHTYASDGTYTVTLTVSNACGSNTSSQNVTVLTLPTANFTANPTQICQRNQVNFKNTSSTNSEQYLWSFPGGTPTSSQLQNPSVYYNNPGTYSVSLTVFNTAGSNTKTVNGMISVSPLPVPSFSYSLNGATVSFNNNSQFANQYTWSFGNGAGSGEPNPVYTYNMSGIYTVILAATNQCGTVSVTQQIEIALAPVASFVLNGNNPACVNEVVRFQSTSSNNPSVHQWFFQGGTPTVSNLANPLVTYSNPGTYDVQLIVSNSNGTDTLSLENFIVIQTIPDLEFAFEDQALNVTFTAEVQNGQNVQWNFGDGQNAAGIFATHSYQNEGEHLVTLSAENICGDNSTSQLINVFAIPSAVISASATTMCNPATISFNSVNNPSVNSWFWTFEGGQPATSTMQNPTVNYASPGNYSVNLTVSNPAGQTTVQMDSFITVNGLPGTGISINQEGNVITLQNTGTNSNETFWTISSQNGSFEFSGATIVFAAPENGAYSITQVNTNECGSRTETLNGGFTVNVYPVPVINLPSVYLCAGETFNFSHNAANGMDYFWEFEGADPETSISESPDVIYDMPGVYSVSLTVSNEFGSRSVSVIDAVVVQGAPEADFEFSINEGITQFTSTGAAGAFLWNFGDQNSTPENPNESTIENPEHVYTRNGIYTVTLIVDNGCGADTITGQVQVILSSADDVVLDKNILVFPNPNSGVFTVNIVGSSGAQTEMMVYDMAGRTISQHSFNTNTGLLKAEINRTDFVSGTYLLRVIQDGKVWNTKFVVK